MFTQLVRSNIRDLNPYSSARDDFSGNANVFLDANENPFNEPFNRYPDPAASKLKEKIAEIKNLNTSRIFTGNGSDEAIDLLIRIFCEPGTDEIISVDPTYGMYQVCAAINNIRIKKIRLTTGFQPDIEQLLSTDSKSSKILFLCSPNNPTANSFEKNIVVKILENFKGIVVIDEAYIDFSSSKGYVSYLAEYPNLVILQTLSKAWGLAGIRLGMAFADPGIISLMNKVKYPYNINILTQKMALERLSLPEKKNYWVKTILEGRRNLETELPSIPVVLQVYPSDANFLLVKVSEPVRIYNYLTQNGIIVRDRSSLPLCEGCIRITAGTTEENQELLDCLRKFES